ncbi:hypothetical protein [Terriglobus saanensis]|uniref:Uncharacterized protein n=1 Tax=Terriglobus saanensis (strain ATCC BAA-1853 / DSM 23119 / SP1PR4) TaxID=401053 RepID=E8V8G3_TERSS|nr:hypothetical protein [Terriglobus saanensis]ADV82942.1 hypothetical protein AciPR4_2140 [Terriglobus saanensis SP1PR4]
MNTDTKPKIHLVQARPSEPLRGRKSLEPTGRNKALELVLSAASTGTLLFLALTFLTLLFSLLPHSVFSATIQQEQRFATRVIERNRTSNAHFGYVEVPIRTERSRNN